jgi:hypothetical protein
VIKVYDTFEKKSITISCLTQFLKDYGYYNKKNRQTLIHFADRTRYCLHRFIKQEYINRVFSVYCLDDGEKYDCVSSNGFLIQIKQECSKSNIHEINRMRCGKRMTISFSRKTYCLLKNKNSINNLMIHRYKDSYLYEAKSKEIKLQRKISNLLRDRIRSALKRKTAEKSQKTIDLIGCSISFLMSYLENKFQKGMAWENQGQWHIDHIIPCASFDLTLSEEQKKCFHYTNLQPLWAKENMSKGSKKS